MSRPKLLDLYCCAGGAAMGYHRAGFDVYGVDIVDQPRYPFPFRRGDALITMHRLLNGAPCRFIDLDGATKVLKLSDFEAIHASPPCQSRTTMSNRYPEARAKHPQLIAPTRELLTKTGLPYVIENVGGARGDLIDPLVLDGSMFGLGVNRPRLFESSVPLARALRRPQPSVVGVYGKHHDGRRLWTRTDGTVLRAAASVDEGREAMGMPWASWHERTEAIPPAYTEFIGAQLLQALEVAA